VDGRFMALRVGFHSPLLQLAGLNFLSPALQKVVFTFINISACYFKLSLMASISSLTLELEGF